MRYGAGPSGSMRNVGKYMLDWGLTLGSLVLGLEPRAAWHIALSLS